MRSTVFIKYIHIFVFSRGVGAPHLWLAWASSHLSQALGTGVCDVRVPYIPCFPLVCSWTATPGPECSCTYIETVNNCVTHQLNLWWLMLRQSLKRWKFILHWHGWSSKKTSQNTFSSSAWSVLILCGTYKTVTLRKGTEFINSLIYEYCNT
jgi:hypothetical protein